MTGSEDPPPRPPAGGVLEALGYRIRRGRAPDTKVKRDENGEVLLDKKGREIEVGWISGNEPWWDLRCDWSVGRVSLAHKLRAASASSGQALSLGGLEYRRVCFGDRENKDQPADLGECRFDKSTFIDTAFITAQLINVYFRECYFDKCDFRYIYAERTSFQNCTFRECDFYRADFDAANVFSETVIKGISLDKAWIEGVIGLRYSHVAGKLIQEAHPNVYGEFLERTSLDAPKVHERSRAKAEAKVEAASVYRALSGMWTEHGQLDDAGKAYVHCKNLELAYFNPFRRKLKSSGPDTQSTRRDDARLGRLRKIARGLSGWLASVRRWLATFIRWSALGLARIVANYGESWWRVGIWIALLIVIPAGGYSLFGGIARDQCETTLHPEPCPVHSFSTTLRYSFERLTDSVTGMHPTTAFAAWVGSAEVFIGIALLGLLGFALANRLRNT